MATRLLHAQLYPRDRASRAAGFWLVAYAFAVTMLGTTLPTPLYSQYVRELDLSTLTVTILFAVYAFAVVGTLVAFGALSDTAGRRPVLLAGLAASGLSAVVFLLAGDVLALGAGRVLSGVAAGVFTGTGTAALVDLAPDERRGFASAVAIVANIGGLACGTTLSGLLAQFAPAPLRLPYAASLVLLVPAAIAIVRTPETVPRRGPVRVVPQRLGVPAEVRAVFVRASLAGGAGFAVTGVLTSVTAIFLADELDLPSHALAGAVVGLAFVTTVVGQLGIQRIPRTVAMPAGCGALAVSAALLIASLAARSLVLLIAGSAVVGIGIGLTVGAGLAAINADAPPARRGETASTFFAILYLALAVPAIGVGLAIEALGLRPAGIVFGALVAALSLGVLADLLHTAARPAVRRRADG